MRKLVWFLAIAALIVPTSGSATEKVHAALVLAVDVSDSVNAHRWRVQQSGYVEAFRDPEVLAALRERRIAVTFMQWSSYHQQEQSVGWRVIRSDADARSFADEIAKVSRRYNHGTAIGAALVHAKHLLDRAPMSATRLIVDISGDGIEYDYDEYGMIGITLEDARARVLDSGIIINGLPIKMKPPSHDSHNRHIDAYYRTKVIGGEGSFAEVVHDGDDPDAFRRALIRKLLRELIAHVR